MLAVLMLALCKFYFQEDSQLCLVAEVPSWPLSLHVTQHLLVNRHGVALGLLGCCIRSPANAFPKHIIHDNTPTLTRNSFPKALDTARLGCCMSWWNNPHQGMVRSIRICLSRNLTYFSSTPCFPDCGHLLRSYIEQLYFYIGSVLTASTQRSACQHGERMVLHLAFLDAASTHI